MEGNELNVKGSIDRNPQPNMVYGRLAESVHISGYSMERAMHELEWLLDEERWKQVGKGYDDINDFLKTLDFTDFKIPIEQRKSIVKRLADIEASQRATANMLGVSHTTIQNDTGNNLPPSKEEAPDNGYLKATNGNNLPPDPFDNDPTKSVKHQQSDVKKEQKILKQKQEFEVLKQKEVAPPTGKYDVIVIDPPWEMEKIKREVAPNQVGFDYPTMSLDEIKKIFLPAEDNCHFFLWITQKYLPHGFELLEEWKMNYICTFVWHKNGGFQPFNLPQYNCEFILYARKGTPSFIDLKNFPTCFYAKRTGHSKKPNEFYELIKRTTAGKRLDMFSRREIEGFDSWGNEI